MKNWRLWEHPLAPASLTRREWMAANRRYGIVGEEAMTKTGSTPSTGRQGNGGEASVSQLMGKYFELAHTQRLAFACAAAGVAPSATVTTTCTMSLHNPEQSGFIISIKKVRIGYISGTMGAGSFVHCVTPKISGIAQTLPSGGTALTSYWTKINGVIRNAAPVGLVRTGSTVVAGVVYGPICSSFPELASTANGFQSIYEDMDGEIELMPGGSYQLQGLLAGGSTPLILPSIVWAELPIGAY